MPYLLRKFLGFILLAATIGLTTCQSMVKADTAGQSTRLELTDNG